MSSKKYHESMIRLDKCYNIVQQSGAKGINAVDIAKKLGVYRTTVYDRLNSLELMNKIESSHGLWYAKTGEQTIKPLEKEIEIELPIPENKWENIALLEALAKQAEEAKLSKPAETIRTFLEKFRETRTIRIKGKNVDTLDLEKIGSMIKEANKKSSMFNFRGIFKIFKKEKTNAEKD